MLLLKVNSLVCAINAIFCSVIINSSQIKSMAEHLDKVDRLCAPRQVRFPDHFMDDISSLVGTLIRDIVDRYVKVSEYNSTYIEHFHQHFNILMTRGMNLSSVENICILFFDITCMTTQISCSMAFFMLV